MKIVRGGRNRRETQQDRTTPAWKEVSGQSIRGHRVSIDGVASNSISNSKTSGGLKIRQRIHRGSEEDQRRGGRQGMFSNHRAEIRESSLSVNHKERTIKKSPSYL